jgi:hypothetical protein
MVTGALTGWTFDSFWMISLAYRAGVMRSRTYLVTEHLDVVFRNRFLFV